MSRVLLLGHGPLPSENVPKLFGPGIRTWQFAHPLIQDGHEVVIICSRIPFIYPAGTPDVIEFAHQGARVYSITQEIFQERQFVQELLDSHRPDCIVGATTFPSHLACQLDSDLPLWVDFFGDTMAEAQAKAHTYADDRYLTHFLTFVRAGLERGDAFSSVSEPQKYALIGQLGLHGRLNKDTFGEDLVHVIPCAVDEETPPATTRTLRRDGVGEEDFVVLWSGGYNTWTDVDTLFQGLELAMAEDPRIKFVSTGGQIDGHDDVTYPRFLRMIEASPYRERFVMRGWIPSEDVPGYVQDSDVGINIDAWSYEAVLGSRNRVVQWMKAGLPVLTTVTSEITQIVGSRRLGYTFEHRDPLSLREAILAVAGDDVERRSRAERARKYVEEHWTFGASTRGLRAWVASPKPAPDRLACDGHLGSRARCPDCKDTPEPESRAAVPSATVHGVVLDQSRPRLNGKPSQNPARRAGAALYNRMSRSRYAARMAMLRAKRARIMRIHFDDTPSRLLAGQETRVPILVENRGSLEWRIDAEQMVNLAYRWRDARGNVIVADGIRTALPGPVAPGASVLLSARLLAPENGGLYLLEWDMVEESVCWFCKDQSLPSLRLAVTVENPHAADHDHQN